MSNFLPSIVDDLGSLYSNISQKDLELLNEDSDYYDQEVTEFVEDIICTISTSMIFEGYSAQAVLSFLAKSSEEDIIENYLSIDKVYITESIVSDEYIQEQFEILDEGIGAALRVLGTGLKMGGKGLLKGTGTALKGAGRTILTATKRAVGPGGRKALKTAATKVKDIAGAAIKRVPTIAKAGLLGGAGVLTGYLGAKLGQGDKTETGKPSSGGSTADEIKNHQKYAASKGKYYSSSDGKTYANYNDALAARNSRLGINPSSGGSEGGSTSSGGGGSTPSEKAAPTKPTKPASAAQTGDKIKDKETFAKANPRLAEVERLRASGASRSEINKVMYNKGTAAYNAAISDKPGPGEKKDQTPTTGPTPAIPDLKSVNADLKKANDPKELNKPAPANSALAKEQERMKKAAEEVGKKAQKQLVKSSYEYDAYDLVLEYLLNSGQASTLDEAHYLMLEMDEKTIGQICFN